MKHYLPLIAVIALAACGTPSNIANDPYQGEGEGRSFYKNIAYNKAYDNAVADIAKKFNRDVDDSTAQLYSSEERGRGKAKEALTYSDRLVETSQASLGDIVVVKKRFKKNGSEWVCNVVVKVSPDNIQ